MTIYLPDNLAKQVKEHDDLNVSAVCQDALWRELTRREQLAGLEKGMERQIVRAYANTSQIPGLDIPPGNHREVAFIGKEIARGGGRHRWRGYLTKRRQIAMWDEEDDGLMVFSSLEDLTGSGWNDANPDVVAEVAEALGEDYTIELDI
jgi:hypothetical protein